VPTYAYRCRDCGHELEVVQSFSDGPLTECPQCSGSLRKVFSPVGISFKGNGFYKTDSRSGSSKNGSSKESGSGDSSSSSSGKESATASSSSSSGSSSSSSS